MEFILKCRPLSRGLSFEETSTKSWGDRKHNFDEHFLCMTSALNGLDFMEFILKSRPSSRGLSFEESSTKF